MKKYYLLLTIMLFTACSNQKISEPSPESNTLSLSNQTAITWIKNNLTPLHSLDENVIRKSISQLMIEDNIPGVSMAFVDQGEVAWTQSFGFENLATSEIVTEKTIFTGASLSKPLTAMAALKLVELGKINLDENVNLVLKEWKVPDNKFTKEVKVTLRHLIGHRAGIKNDLWSSYLPHQRVPSLTQMLAGRPPSVDPATSVIATPDSVEKYSNPGYAIIQQILKDVSQDSFDNVLDTLILNPSGMMDSSFQQPMPETLQQRRAIGYEKNLTPYPYRLFPYKAAGGVWTTPTDMAKFIITLFEDYAGKNNILSPSMAAQVFSRSSERLGFSKIFNAKSDDLIFRHYGSNQGFTSYMIGSLLRKQAVVIMINSDNGFNLLDYIARSVAEYYQWDYLQPIVYQAYSSEILTIRDYAGKFNNNSEILTFTFKDEYLWVNSEKYNAPVKLIPVGFSQFISINDSVKYEFYRKRGSKKGIYKWARVIEPSGRGNYAERVL